ncbi:MAG: NAD(P)H-hydrate dehydratase, partial [Lachnospiraceae bacterium]
YSGSIRLSANAAVYIDALFGIGLGREVRGDFAAAIRIMNEAKGKVVAADIPSGISADTGQVLGTAVRADVTVTMQCGKPGLFLDPGRQYAGEVRIRDIGIWSQFCSRTDGILRFAQNDRHLEKNWLPPRPICMLEKSDLSTLLPRREPSGNKGTFGKVLLIAGSENMAGAAILAARAVLASGAGMVKVLTPACNREILQISVPEALLATYTPENVEKVLQSNLSFGNVVAIGPGLGTGPEARRLVRTVMEVSEDSVVSKDSQKSLLVLDADALNIIASENLRESLPKGAFLTPHIVEFSRISELSAKEIQADRLSAARAFAERYGVRLILKDARTVICGDGEAFINLSGNDGLATAGSGDVLTGILAGLLAQGTEPAFAGPTAAFLHGLAGDAAAEKMGRRSMNAGDVCSSLPMVLK